MALTPPTSRVDRTSNSCPDLDVFGWGSAQVPSERIVELRRSMPDWAPSDTPNHFFRYADEQTILAVLAVDDAIRNCGLDPVERRDWGVIAAPRFLGRQVTAQAVDQYQQTGGQRVSPHIVPQNSLHSVSGALSILLATHGLNVGLGGGPEALTDGLMAALSLVQTRTCPGAWFVATGWDPEPLPDRKGLSSSPGICHALALAVRPGPGMGLGKLSLDSGLRIMSDEPAAQPSFSDVVSELQELGNRETSRLWRWRLSWGATLKLKIVSRQARQRLAA